MERKGTQGNFRHFLKALTSNGLVTSMFHKLSSLLRCLISIACSLLVSSCFSGSSSPPSQINEHEASNLSVEAVYLEEALFYKDCSSPCWIGIELGVTGGDKAERILKQRYGIENVEVNGNSLTWVSSENLDGSRGGNLTIVEGISERLSVWFVKDEITVEDLIEVIGIPESVRVVRAFSSEVKCAGSSLFYHRLRLDAYLEPADQSVGVEPSQFVSGLNIVSARLAEDWRVTDSVYLEWAGYQDYCELAFDD